MSDSAKNASDKYINVGTIVENKTKEGKLYKQLILHKDFLANAGEYIKLAYLDKNGGRRFSIFPPSEKAPDYILGNVVLFKDEK